MEKKIKDTVLIFWLRIILLLLSHFWRKKKMKLNIKSNTCKYIHWLFLANHRQWPKFELLRIVCHKMWVSSLLTGKTLKWASSHLMMFMLFLYKWQVSHNILLFRKLYILPFLLPPWILQSFFSHPLPSETTWRNHDH